MEESKQKRIKVPIRNTAHYVRLFNGMFKLTDTEIEIISAFIDEYRAVKYQVPPISTPMKKKVADRLGRDNFNTLNQYIKNLVKKRAIIKKGGGDDYIINPALIRNDKETEVVFILS